MSKLTYYSRYLKTNTENIQEILTSLFIKKKQVHLQMAKYKCVIFVSYENFLEEM